ncbi:hypothetical protein [Mycobacteroides abscessus]
MKQRLYTLVAVAALLVAGCETPTKTSEPTPVATTTTVTDTQGVIPRFTTDIWPAINAYNSDPAQGGPGYQQWTKIITKLDAEQYGKLRDAVHKLGTVREANQDQGALTRNGNGLKLIDAGMASELSDRSELNICYTYTASLWDGTDSRPAASQATIELRKTDNWYLYAITNDHAVQGCSASPKV